MYDGRNNRSYYAVFNAIRSLLSLVKLDSGKHSGVISLFDKYFIKTGIFDKRYSKIVHSAFDTRQDYDYEDFSTPTEIEANSQFNDAQVFIAKVEQKRAELINGEIGLPNVPEELNGL